MREAATHMSAAAWLSNGSSNTMVDRVLCPDLLSIRDIGEADGWRGRAVRGFFRILKLVTGV